MLFIVKQCINVILPSLINLIILIIIKRCNHFFLSEQTSAVWQQVNNDRSNEQSDVLSGMFQKEVTCNKQQQPTRFTLN